MKIIKISKKYTNLIALISLILCFSITYNAQEVNRQNSQELKLGEMIKSELGGGKIHIHNYHVNVATKSSLYIVVNQKGVDVVVRLYDQAGKKVFEIDSPNGTEGTEPVFWVSEHGGIYRVEIDCPDENAKPGNYEVILNELRMSYDEDEKLLFSEQVFIDADKLWLEGSNNNKSSALEAAFSKYEQALSLYNELNSYEKYKNSKVTEEFSPIKQAYILNRMGQILFLTQKYRESINACEKSLAIYEKNDVTGNYLHQQADCLSNIGEAWKYNGNKAQALENYLKALPLYQKIGDKSGELVANNNIGAIYDLLGQKREALKFYLKALGLADFVGDLETKATVLANLGLIYEDLEEHQKALDSYNEALNFYRNKNKIGELAVVISNIGVVYDNLGNYKRALEFYNEAIENFDKVGKLVGKAGTLVNKGVVCEKIAKMDLTQSSRIGEAVTYYKEALGIFEAKNKLREKASVLNKIASVQLSNKNYDQAFLLLQESLVLRKKTNDLYGEAYTDLLIGNVFSDQKNYEKAFKYYSESLLINREIGDIRGESVNLYYIAECEKFLGRAENAKNYIESAINIVENSRLNVRVQKLRNTYLAKSQLFYELYVHILMQLYREKKGNYDILAFEANERSRSKGLLEILSEQNRHIYDSVDSMLISLQRSQQSLLDDKLSELINVKRAGKSENEVSALESEIEKIKLNLEKVESKINSTISIEVSAKVGALDLKSIQKTVLDDDTVLLQYCLGEEKSYLWVITNNSIKTYELPDRKVIEKLAEKVYRNVVFRSQRAEFKADTEKEKWLKIQKSEQKYHDFANQLSQIIIGPALEGFSKNKKRLIIIADGELRHIPFSILPIPSEKDFQVLINRFELVNLPSASSLAVSRTIASSDKNSTKSIAVIADPIYNINDERLSKYKHSRLNTNEVAVRGIEQNERGSDIVIERLPYTGDEAQSIITLARPEQYAKFVGFEACRSRVLQILDQYSMLHFAVHGLSNRFSTELSGILLSVVDENGVSINGVLSRDKVASLHLKSDLVVLSSCESGLGEDFAGEGTIGIARAFTYAGAKRVVTSMWPVDDQATSQFMKIFYTGIFKKNLPPSASLHNAQLEMMKNPRWSSPFFWGAFTIEGEYR